MKIYWRLLILLLITWLLVAGFYFVALAPVLFYLHYFRGYELIFIGVLIDGYYQYFYEWPIFSLILFGLVILVNLIKPHLLMYNRDNEMV